MFISFSPPINPIMRTLHPPFKKKHRGRLNNLSTLKQLVNMEQGLDYRQYKSRVPVLNHYLGWAPLGQKKNKASVTQ